MADKRTILPISAQLVISPESEQLIDQWDLEDLQHRIYELMMTSVPVTLRRGPITGKIVFTTPNPIQLKLARMAAESRHKPTSGDQSSTG